MPRVYPLESRDQDRVYRANKSLGLTKYAARARVCTMTVCRVLAGLPVTPAVAEALLRAADGVLKSSGRNAV